MMVECGTYKDIISGAALQALKVERNNLNAVSSDINVYVWFFSLTINDGISKHVISCYI